MDAAGLIGLALIVAGLLMELFGATMLRARYGWPWVRRSDLGTPSQDWRTKLYVARGGMAVGAILLLVTGVSAI
jgi:hypothetical protein